MCASGCMPGYAGRGGYIIPIAGYGDGGNGGTIGGTAGGTTPPHHPTLLPGNTGEPMYRRPLPFPCPLPCCPIAPRPLPPTLWSAASPCPFPCSPCCLAPFPCLPLPPSTCPAPLPCTAVLLCSACPPLIPVLPGFISNWLMVSGPCSGGWRRRRWCSTCASASYHAACWRRTSLSSSAFTAALTLGGDLGGDCLNKRWGCGHCRPRPLPFHPFPAWCPFACTAPDVPTCPFPPLPVRPLPPALTLLSLLPAAPASSCPRPPLPAS